MAGYSFDKKSVDRIAKVVRHVERVPTGGRPPVRYYGGGGGKSTASALFKLSANIPARVGLTLGSASLTMMTIGDDGLMTEVDGDAVQVFNFSTTEILAWVDETPANCEISPSEQQFIVATKIDGKWVTGVGQSLELTNTIVGTEMLLNVDGNLEMRTSNVTVVGRSTTCTPDVITVQDCDA